MAVVVLAEKCKGCGLCLKSCPFGAIDMQNKLAVLNEKCTGCKGCVEACPFGAFEALEEQKEEKDLSAYSGVWVFAEQREGALMPVVAELLGEGRRLADEIGTYLGAVLCGEKVAPLAEELGALGADKVFLCEDALLKSYTTDAYTKVIAGAIRAHKPEIVLYGATHIGRDLAPALAAEVDTGLTADCTRLEIDPADKKLMQTRPAFGGNLMATILCPAHRPQMSTVRPGVMQRAEAKPGKKAALVRLEAGLQAADLRTRVLETVKTVKEAVNLTEANFIVSGGKGLGGPDGFALLQQLADKLGGVVAASRACVDEGWIDHARQVGQTGTTVKPSIYVACGISGAIQHLAGMQESDIIVAINKNEEAPIFEVADYGIVADLYEAVPQILQALDA